MGADRVSVVYIAGPMTGHPDYNYPAFNEAEQQLRAIGHEPLNPARRGIRPGWTYGDYLRHAIRDVLLADAIAVLPDWQSSRGARLETDIGHVIGIPVVPVDFFTRGEPAHVRSILHPPQPCPICDSTSCAEADHRFAPRPGAAE
jgi:hypothetical protein